MSALIFDRTQADADRAAYLIGKIQRGETLTESEQAEYFAGLKGCYNIADLNRVEAKVRELAEVLRSYGYSVDYTVPMKGSSVLPEGYTELEYIQSSGTQYINTGIVPSSALITEIIYACESSGIVENAIFGSAWSASGYFFMAYSGINGFRWHSCGGYADAAVSDATAKHTAICQKGKLSLDGIEYNFSASGSDSTNAVRLFGVTSNAGYAGAANGIYKLYRCKMHNGNTVYRDFIPCKNASGVVGLLDIINNTFYSNAGTGTFVAGNTIAGDDREWQRTDTMRESDVLLYLANIAALRNVIQLSPDIPPIPTADQWISWMAANDIERIVFELDRMIYGIVPLFRRCGTFRAGKNAQHLLLAKGVN